MKTHILLLAAITLSFVCGFGQNLEWVRAMGGSGRDKGYAFDLDKDGNLYVTGYFSETVDFDPGPNEYNLVSNGGYDAFILKIDNEGDFIWAKNIGGTSKEIGRGIELDDAGNIYVAGYFTGTGDFAPGPDTALLMSAGKEDVFFCKMDSNGDFIWAKSIGGTGVDALINMTVDKEGNIYGTGFYSGGVDFDPSGGISIPGGSSRSVDVFTFKFNADGDYQWAKVIVGADRADQGFGVAVDSKGNVYTTGSFYSGTVGLDFDPGPASEFIPSSGDRDIFLRKLDANGNFLWAKSMGGISRDEGYTIAIDTDDNVYLTGYFRDTANFESGTNAYVLAAIDGRDAFVQKLDSSGNVLWIKQLGGKDYVVGQLINLDKDNNVYVTGFYDEELVLDSTGTSKIVTAGGTDIFLQKLDKDGNQLWVKSMGGKGNDSGEYVRVDDSGYIYMAGFYGDSCDFDFNAGERIMTGYGDLDMFMLKINTNPTSLNALFSFPIELYPNPNTGVFRIELPEGSHQVKLRILDQTGRMVYQGTVHEDDPKLDMNHLNAGVYHVLLNESSGEGLIGKLVIH